VLLAGCGSVLGIEDFAPPMIKGALRDLDNDSVKNAKLVFFDDSGTKVGETTTNDRGDYEFPLTGQLPVNGYFEVNDPRLVHTFSHLLTPALDRTENSHEIQTLSAEGLRNLVTAAEMVQGPSSWLVVGQVADDQGSSAVGAMVEAVTQNDPTRLLGLCYTKRDETGRPCGGSSTADDALAWIFDVPENATLTISAVDADGGAHSTSFPTVAGPGLIFTPVPPTR